MQSTYAQKNETIQKASANTAESVVDSSSQSATLQRHASLANAAVQRAENPPRPNNTGLPDDLKNGIESLSGYSLDNVRVHYNSPKPATVQALAFTQGTDIHVAPGQEHALPHEAWHVTQQMAGRVTPTTNIGGMPVNDNAALEHEADVMGEKAVTQRMGKSNFVNENDACNLQIVQLRSKRNFTSKCVNTPVMQLVRWNNIKVIDKLNQTVIQNIYRKLTNDCANASKVDDAKTIENNTQGFDQKTIERLEEIGEKTKNLQIPQKKTEWWWARVMLQDRQISAAVKKTRIKSANVPDAKTNPKERRDALAFNAIYYHATSKSLVDTIMQNGLTTSAYRMRKSGDSSQTTTSGLAANADCSSEQYQMESPYSVYVTGRYAEAKQYREAISKHHKKKGSEDEGVIIFPILTNIDEDFEVDADSTGIKTAPSTNSSSNYLAIGTEYSLNPRGLKLMELAVGPASPEDEREPLDVYKGQVNKIS